MTLFLPLLSHPNPQKKWKKNNKKIREIDIIIIIIQYFF